MNTIKGDLITLATEGKFDVIIHGCNCFCTMGAGIAKTIKQKFPEAYQADLATKKGEQSKLGTVSWTEIKTTKGTLIIVNGYTKFHWKGNGRKVDYEAVRAVFKNIKDNFSGLRIGYPAIGAGLAGGNWDIVSQIIEEELEGEDHTFVAFKNLNLAI